MKKYVSKRALVLILALIMCFLLSACFPSAGKSAYEIACDNGFVGTEKEWLESLNGKNGENGTNGQDSTSIDIYSLFEAYQEVYPDATFAGFLNSFLIADYYDTEYAAAKGMASAVRVQSKFAKKSGSGTLATTDYYVQGSGVVYKIIDEYAYIITNYHVVYDYGTATANKISSEITLYFYGSNTSAQAEFIGGAPSKDIAVIKALRKDMSNYIQICETADSNAVAVGSRAVAVGNPLADGISVTSGIISVDSETIEMEALDSLGSVDMRVMRVDTAINSGNSGGGLYNARGQLIGIVNAKTILDGVENIGYAIPSNVAVGIADCVIENNAKKCVFGVYIKITESHAWYNNVLNTVEIMETLMVVDVDEGAFASGYVQENDVLLSAAINGGAALELKRSFYLSDFLFNARLNDVIKLTIKRGGETMTVELTVNESCLLAIA